MGISTSKVSYESDGMQVHNNDPNNSFNTDCDPRSPTPEIMRTPLQGKTGLKHNITKNVDLRKSFENGPGDQKLFQNNPILSAVIKNHLQSYDPRSPTQEFERTPIILTSQINEYTDKYMLRQENAQVSENLSFNENNFDTHVNNYSEEKQVVTQVIPRNLYDGFFDMTLDDTFKEMEQPMSSSTASQETIETNIVNDKKPVKFLETNFDYIENHNHKENDKSNNSVNDYVNEIQTTVPFEILKTDPRSPSVGIERTPIIVTKQDVSCNENIEELSDDILIKALQDTNTDLRQTIVNRLEKNDELLIYEDESVNPVYTPKKSAADCNSGSRTPLSCMKNKADSTHVRSKSANTELESKMKKLAASKRVSHIPRLKALSKPLKCEQSGSMVSLKNISKTSVISGDCENTPPHSHRDIWDKDNSIVL